MMRVRATLLGLALLVAGAASVEAQVVQKNFQVAAFTGYQSYTGGSGLKSGAWTFGGTASYYVTSSIGVGLWTDLAFAEADGGKFPLAALSFQDSTTLNVINQPLQLWNFGGHIKFQLPERKMTPFALVGGGGYLMFLDPQQQDDLKKVSGGVILLGVGLDFAVSESVGFEVFASDHWYPKWDAKDDPFRIFPVEQRPVGLTAQRKSVINTRFPDLNASTDDLSNSVHNFSIVAGVTVVPGQ